MTYAQIFNASTSIRSLSGQNLKIKQAYRLYDFSKKLNEHYDFFRAELQKIMQRHNVTLTENYTFKGTGDQAAFEREMHELQATEIEDLEELELSVPGDVRLSRDDIELLSGVIKFVFEDDPALESNNKRKTEGTKE